MKTGKAAAGDEPCGVHSTLEAPAESTGMNFNASGERAIKPPGASRRSCERYVRQRLMADMPSIADSLLLAARSGGVAELKALLQLSGVDRKRAPSDAKRRGRSFADILMDNWRKEPLNEDACDSPARPDA